MTCLRNCGREALDGHLTCGDVMCDEAGARDELAPALQRARLNRSDAAAAIANRLTVTIPRLDFVALWSVYLACIRALETPRGAERALRIFAALDEARLAQEVIECSPTLGKHTPRGGS